jgi:Protein of unknown function (DUF3180)
MKQTRWVPLVAITAIALAVGWVLVDVVERVSGRILGVPWLAAVALWVLALGVLGWTVLSRGRLGEKPKAGPAPVMGAPEAARRAGPDKRMPPLVAARTAALALAASRTGALIGGFYLGIALGLIGVRDTPTGSASFAAAMASVIACVVLVGAALWLESLCRLRDGDDAR